MSQKHVREKCIEYGFLPRSPKQHKLHGSVGSILCVLPDLSVWGKSIKVLAFL